MNFDPNLTRIDLIWAPGVEARVEEGGPELGSGAHVDVVEVRRVSMVVVVVVVVSPGADGAWKATKGEVPAGAGGRELL